MIAGKTKKKKALRVVGYIEEKETVIETVSSFGEVQDLLSTEDVKKYERFAIVEVFE